MDWYWGLWNPVLAHTCHLDSVLVWVSWSRLWDGLWVQVVNLREAFRKHQQESGEVRRGRGRQPGRAPMMGTRTGNHGDPTGSLHRAHARSYPTWGARGLGWLSTHTVILGWGPPCRHRTPGSIRCRQVGGRRGENRILKRYGQSTQNPLVGTLIHALQTPAESLALMGAHLQDQPHPLLDSSDLSLY